ncbi:MAG: hypothetical protein ACI9BW_002882 [Gammaproteobacteria bacterium]
MIKVISIFKRKAGLSVEDFQKYWSNEHAEIVCRMPEVHRYVQSHTRLSGYRNRVPAWDGVAELWFENSDALRSLSKRSELKTTQADHEKFMDTSSYMEFIAEDVVIKDGAIPSDGVKNIELVKRKPGMDPGAFHQYWIDVHGPLGGSIPQVLRYVQSHTRIGAYANGREPVLDGVALTWFNATADMRASAETQEYASTRADEANFLTEPLDFVIVDEKVIMD